MADKSQIDGSLRELALFAGGGGGILGGKLLGWQTVCAVELDPYAASILVARQNDGLLDPFPIWDDVRTFDGRPWRGRVDVVSGGFPCTDISVAGKGEGIEGEQSGLWKEMGRIIREVRPRFVLVENSPMLTSRGLGVVLGHLAAMGFDAKWGVLGACHTGAPHDRERIWILAYANGLWKLQPEGCQQNIRKRAGDGCKREREREREQRRRWPTPVASMSKGSSKGALTRKNGRSRENDRLDHAVMAADGGPLNPEWVEWLMGWPLGWTDLKPLEMDKFHTAWFLPGLRYMDSLTQVSTTPVETSVDNATNS